jgi:uncharacterized protein (TIGR00251 family)
MSDETKWLRLNCATRCLTLHIHLQPNSKSNGIAGVHDNALKIRIAAPAVDNKANAALVDFLHRFLDLPPSRISIQRGAKGRRKVVEIAEAGSATQALIRSAASN